MKTRKLLKDFCKYVYYAGIGNYWSENMYPETVLYKMYTTVSFSIYTTMIFLENLAALFGDFPEVEKNSANMFFAIHNIVLTKMALLMYHKESIRKLNFEMAAVGEKFEEEHVMKRQYLKVKIGILLYVVSVYLSLGAYGVESTRRAYAEGVPFYTVVTYLPYYDDDSTIASFFRVFFYVTWLYMMLPMMSADCLPIAHLVMLAFKFMTLCHHYDRIREEFDHDVLTLNKKRAVEKLKAGFLEGILMHQQLLHLADEIHRVFGIIMSLQVCESSAVAVLLLLRLALSPHMDLTNAFMTYTFVCSLFILLALNLWNAGEITYQASLLSGSMFYSGWYLCEMEEHGKDIRHFVLISCAQAQKPLILKAFGVQELSYETFVSVARMTYSIFAVFYQRGE
ncbi:putative odorant receptor 85d [Amyelois transitella]|uniref:putative odorant receptor 85d n=1 Tax=Amyelois transitella TaxID=680683 RepID=UPI00067D5512|nr:putative odorant receptor 85d [Amyelois transitella]